jgi:hypothetical protein
MIVEIWTAPQVFWLVVVAVFVAFVGIKLLSFIWEIWTIVTYTPKKYPIPSKEEIEWFDNNVTRESTFFNTPGMRDFYSQYHNWAFTDSKLAMVLLKEHQRTLPVGDVGNTCTTNAGHNDSPT